MHGPWLPTDPCCQAPDAPVGEIVRGQTERSGDQDLPEVAVRRAIPRPIHRGTGALRPVARRRRARQWPPERVQPPAPAVLAHDLREAHVAVDHETDPELRLQPDVDPDVPEQLAGRTPRSSAKGQPLHHVLARLEDCSLRLLSRQIRPELAEDRSAELVHVAGIGATYEEL